MSMFKYNIRAKTKDNQLVFMSIKGREGIHWTHPNKGHHWWYVSSAIALDHIHAIANSYLNNPSYSEQVTK